MTLQRIVVVGTTGSGKTTMAGRRKREIPALLAAPEYAHLLLIHHRSPRQAEQWFSRVEQGQA